jgi:hypothetical protein
VILKDLFTTEARSFGEKHKDKTLTRSNVDFTEENCFIFSPFIRASVVRKYLNKGQVL